MRKILSKLKQLIKKHICIWKYRKYQMYCKKNKQSEFLIFNSPIHGNIGDHAIIYAEYKMLENINIKAFEIPTFEEKYYFKYIEKNVAKDAIISITGGGFIGSQWLEEENLVNKVIQTFKAYKILIFPATFYFKDDEIGKRELEKSLKIFKEAQNVTVFARESKTYEFIKENYNNVNVFLAPDIVLSLESSYSDNIRKEILLCMRKDVEGIFSNEEKDNLFNKVKKYNLNIKRTDTVADYYINSKERDKEIENKLKEFASSKVVITDRLHGMIFAFITNTPCIVFGNYNYKVKGVYERWIKNNCTNIIFCDNIQNIDTNIEKLIETKFEPNKKIDFKDLIKALEEYNG